MSNANTLNVASQEIVVPILAQLTSDIAECLDCEWAVVMDGLGAALVPLYTFGQNSNLEQCVSQTNTLLSGQLAGIDLYGALVTLHDSNPKDWMPRILCPVRVHDEIVAVLALGPRNTADGYADRDQKFIATLVTNVSFLLSDARLAAKVGMEITRSRRTNWELQSAREVQQRLFPCKLPRISGLDYYGESQPVGQLGGDFFDFIRIGDSSLLLSIGDVSGKGIPSAIIMAAVQASLRALGPCMDFDICKLMHNLNRIFWQLAPDNFFATMFCARLDVARREIHYVNAGHDRAVLLRAGKNRAITLESTGGVLGLSTRTVFERRAIQLEPGDTLVAVTDGITETADSGAYELERAVLDGLRERVDRSARDLAQDIMQAAQANGENAQAPPDDKTVVVVRRIKEMAETFVPVPIRPRTLAHAAGF